MAILLHQSDRVGTQSIEYMPGSARDYKIGEVLTMSGGQLVLGGVDSTGEQTYLCAAKQTVSKAGELVAVYRLTPERVYAATLTADGTALKVGDKVTLSDDLMGVTATTDSGVAEIVGMDGAAVGNTAYIRFN